MNTLNIEDLRSFVFCIYSGIEKLPGTLDFNSLQFLGTGFFVTKNGDAVTAAHVLPRPDQLKPKEQLFAITVFDDGEKYCRIVMSAFFREVDLVLFRVQTERESNIFFKPCFEEVGNGDDVIAFGVPEHNPSFDISRHRSDGATKQLRTLKGHISLRHGSGLSELSFPVPGGMSGGPVLVGTKCVGYLVGSVTSKQIIDRTEEIVELTNEREKIEITEITQFVTYGMFNPFSRLNNKKLPILEDRTLEDFLARRNEL